MNLIHLLRQRRQSAHLMGIRLRAQVAADRAAIQGDNIAERVQEACLREIRKLARGSHVRVKIGTSPHLHLREVDIDLTPGR